LLARTSLRPLRDSAIHSLALTPLKLEGDWVVMMVVTNNNAIVALLFLYVDKRNNKPHQVQ
jgi:hypothetical protein